MAGDQKYTAEEKARHAARVKEREARKKERQKQKKALTKAQAPAPQATNGGHKTYDASLLKRARNVGGPPYEAFLKYLPHDCPIAASRGAAAPSRHLHESSPGEDAVGGLLSILRRVKGPRCYAQARSSR